MTLHVVTSLCGVDALLLSVVTLRGWTPRLTPHGRSFFRETSRQVLCRGLSPKRGNPVRAAVTTGSADTNRERVGGSARGARSPSWAGLWRGRQIYGANVLAGVPYLPGISSNFGQATP